MQGKIRFEYKKLDGDSLYLMCLPTEDLVESIKLFEEYRKLRIPLYLDDEDFAKFNDDVFDEVHVSEIYSTVCMGTRVEDLFVTVILE